MLFIPISALSSHLWVLLLNNIFYPWEESCVHDFSTEHDQSSQHSNMGEQRTHNILLLAEAPKGPQ